MSIKVYTDIEGNHFNLPQTEYYQRVFTDKRNALFSDSKWAFERFQEDKDLALWAPWKAYRQALRDMPAQEGFDIANPVFPLSPNEV